MLAFSPAILSFNKGTLAGYIYPPKQNSTCDKDVKWGLWTYIFKINNLHEILIGPRYVMVPVRSVVFKNNVNVYK